jgi:flagellar M-ring protein FliF
MDTLTRRLAAFRAWFSGLEQARKMWFVAISGLAMAGLVVAFEVATNVAMAPLFDSGVDPRTNGEIVAFLEARGTDHTVEAGTDRILVPLRERERLRLHLQNEGIVSDKLVGLELFDENRFGSTRFVEHVRYVRGLQGEIERQINLFDQVAGSKVLLSLPEQSLFEEDVVDPSASVHLDLKSGTTLSAKEGKRIATLVANAVPRLTADAVEIVDAQMHVIHAATGEGGEARAASKLSDLKRDYERYYTGEVERILERVVGPGKVVARVNVTLDNAQRSLDERKLHPDEAVAVSTETFEQSETGGTSQSGLAGSTTNLKDAKAANGIGTSVNKESSSTREIGNFDVPHTWRSEATLPGGIQSITAAVLVDGTWKELPVEGEGKGKGAAATEPKTEYVPRTAEELASFSALVAGALGVQATAVTMVNQPFASIDVQPATGTRGVAMGPGHGVESYMKYGFAFLALALTFGFIVRPVMKTITEPEPTSSESEPAQLGEGATVAGALPDADANEARALADLIDRIGSGNEHITRGEVSKLVSSDITHSLVTLQAWLAED